MNYQPPSKIQLLFINNTTATSNVSLTPGLYDVRIHDIQFYPTNFVDIIKIESPQLFFKGGSPYYTFSNNIVFFQSSNVPEYQNCYITNDISMTLSPLVAGVEFPLLFDIIINLDVIPKF